MSKYFNIYRKLVRDKIPSIIEADGEKVDLTILEDDQDFLEALCKKVREESRELQESPSKEEQLAELADLMEVVSTLIHHLGFSEEEVRSAMNKKRNDRGGFSQRIFLNQTIHEQNPSLASNSDSQS